MDAILLQGQGSSYGEKAAALVEYQAQEFVNDMLGALRERQLDLRTGRVIFVGGGACLLRRQIQTSGKVGAPHLCGGRECQRQGLSVSLPLHSDRGVMNHEAEKGGRFTVRFDMENPDHVRAVKYLEQQRDRGKAQYLADAILCYEKAETKIFPQADARLDSADGAGILSKAKSWVYPGFAKRGAVYIFAANRFNSQCFGRF